LYKLANALQPCPILLLHAGFESVDVEREEAARQRPALAVAALAFFDLLLFGGPATREKLHHTCLLALPGTCRG